MPITSRGAPLSIASHGGDSTLLARKIRRENTTVKPKNLI